MSGTSLELIAAHGDETIGGVRFVVVGTSAEESARIAREGLSFVEGQGLVTTNLLQAYAQAKDAGEGGVMNVIAVPPEFHVGYPAFTTTYIIRSTKTVMGAPLRYASGRKQLALYSEADTNAVRARVEAEVVNGSPFEAHASFQISPHNIVGTFKPTEGLHRTLVSLEVSAKAFEAFDTAQVESALIELFDSREAAQAVLVPTMVHSLMVGMVESAIIARLRMMRWQGLAMLGYKFQEGSEDVAVTRVVDMAEQRRLMAEYRNTLASSGIFAGELAWLKVYATHQLELMRVELDGAELEAA
jgi:hypothetical protein